MEKLQLWASGGEKTPMRRLNTEVLEVTFHWWWNLQDASPSRYHCWVDSTWSRWPQVQRQVRLLVFSTRPWEHYVSTFPCIGLIQGYLQSHKLSTLKSKVALHFCADSRKCWHFHGVATEDINKLSFDLTFIPTPWHWNLSKVRYVQINRSIWHEVGKLERMHRLSSSLFVVTWWLYLKVPMRQFLLNEEPFFFNNASQANGWMPVEMS